MRQLPIPSSHAPRQAQGMNFDSDILATRIRERREALNLSQGEVSRRAGVRPETISRYEGGKNRPRLEELAGIATALATSIDYLVGMSDDPAPARDSRPIDETERGLIDRVVGDLKQDEATAEWVREQLEASAYRGASYNTLWSYANDLLLGRSGKLRVPSPTPEKPALRGGSVVRAPRSGKGRR
jgi:transcriptional regulator with XRE-family HTH domain